MRVLEVELEATALDDEPAWATVRLTGHWHRQTLWSPEEGPIAELVSVVRDSDLAPMLLTELSEAERERVCREAEEQDRERCYNPEGPEEP